MATTSSTIWPDATSTGVSAGVTLTPYYGDLVINTAGAVISGLDIHGTVYINAPNVTLLNCQVTVANYFQVRIANVAGVTVQNCTINGVGTGNDGSGGIVGAGTFLNNNIYNVENGISVDGSSATVIAGNYIHNLLASGSPHYDGIQIDGGLSNIIIDHNTIINTFNQTAAIMIDNYYGPVSNVSVNNNLLVGGGYTVYDDAQFGGGTISGVSFTNNHMGTGSFGITDFNQTSPVYTGNVNDGATLVSTLNTSANAAAGTTAPGAPTIASFSTDSGVVGDGITNNGTLSLHGTAAANSKVNVFDGAAPIGTTTANASGSWDYITKTLTDAKHMLTAIAVNSSGQSSAASSPLEVTVDSVAPNVPQITSSAPAGNNTFLLKGTAEAKSAVQVFDGATKIGNVTADSTGAWNFTTAALSPGSHNMTIKAMDVAGNLSPASPVVSATVGLPVTSAPTISSFSDSGKVGDGVTNDNTPTLTGTAVANSTVNVLDGTTQIGSAKADGNGAWTFTATAALVDGNHNLTASAGGTTSATSSVLSIKVDTTAPGAPVLSKDSVVNTNQVLLTGTAEANSTVKIYDGTAVVGTATTDANGAWTTTSAALKNGSHNLTATATDVAGNTSVMSKPLDPVIGEAPNAPVIGWFSRDSGTKGDGITKDNTLTLTGTADANSAVKVYDSGKEIGTASTDGSGAWKYTTAVLPDGDHSLTARDASGQVDSESSALHITIDTHAPVAPTMAAYAHDGKAVNGTTAAHDLVLKGTAEANSSVSILDRGKQVGTTNTDGDGHWSFESGYVTDGNHNLTSKAVDAAGNVSAASTANPITVDPPASTVGLTNIHKHWDHTVTIKGSADAYSQIKIYDGTTSVGSVDTKADGTWNFTTSCAASKAVHTYTAQELGTAGHVVASSGSAILGTRGSNTLASTAGDDLLVGSGGHDTFVFEPNFGRDVIKDFGAGGRGHDVVQFSKSVFDSFAQVLAHATQSGHDVILAAGAADSVTLKNVKLSALDKTDFHIG